MKKLAFFFAAMMIAFAGCSQNHLEKQNMKKTVNKKIEKAVLPKIDHIVIVVEENHSKEQITNNSSAPYMNLLMQQGANFTNYHAIEHPSQPNYLDLFSGTNQGITNDKVPKDKFSAPNLASELLQKNYSFIGYSEDLPSVGFNGVSSGPGGYARKHNPWVNFNNVPIAANQPLRNIQKDYSQLPTVSFIIPNLRHDMHDGTIREADQWLKKNISSYVKWAQTHNSLLVVTWDEDEGTNHNVIPTFFVGPMLKPGQYTQSLNHYNLLRTIEDIYGLKHAGKANSSKSIVDIWKK